MAAGDDLIERAYDPIAILVVDHEGGQQLDGMARMPRNLTEDLVLLEQRDGDELAEQSLVGGFEHAPRSLQSERFGCAELDADHQAFAADVAHHLVMRDDRG